MAGAYRVLRVPLSQHLHQLKKNAEQADFGYTHQSLLDELQNQVAIEEELDAINGSAAGEERGVQRELGEISKIVDVNKECLHYLSGITDLEDFYSDLTTINAKRVLDLVSQKMKSRFWRRKLSSKVRRAWQNIGRYSELVTLHLKNAADFHQFYYDARQVEVKLNERCHKFLNARRRYNWDNCEGTVVEARELTNLLKTQYQHLEYLAARSREILERSSQVVPIHLRLNRLKGPVNGVMLCDYETPNFKLSAGDSVVVLSNSSSYPAEQSQTSESQTESRSELASGTTTSEDINDLASGHVDGVRGVPSEPAVHRPPVPFRWERREDQTSGTESALYASTSYLTGSSLQGPSADKLQWHVRTPDGSVDGRVPAVCVWIPAPDLEARERSIALNRILLDTWKDIIDDQLLVCLRFFKRLLRRLLESDGITTDDDEAFKRFLHELTYSLSEPPSAENDDTRNKEFLELISVTRELWQKTRQDGARLGENVTHLKRTEISNFHCVLVWIKIHMQTNREYEQQISSTYQVSQKHLEELRSESYKITETITVLNEVAKKEREKVDELLRQLHEWNAGHRMPTEVRPSPSTSSEEQLLSSSGSEISDTEVSESGLESHSVPGSSEYSSELVMEEYQTKMTTKTRFPSMTYMLPAIFAYGEQGYSDEVASSEEASSVEDAAIDYGAETDSYTKWRDGQIYQKWVPAITAAGGVGVGGTESESTELESGEARYVSTKSLNMSITLEPDVPLRSPGRTVYRSRQQIDTAESEKTYSVVYIEVARADQSEDRTGGTISIGQFDKAVQADHKSPTSKVRRITQMREEEEEDESLIRREARKILISPARGIKVDNSVQTISTLLEGRSVGLMTLDESELVALITSVSEAHMVSKTDIIDVSKSKERQDVFSSEEERQIARSIESDAMDDVLQEISAQTPQPVYHGTYVDVRMTSALQPSSSFHYIPSVTKTTQTSPERESVSEIIQSVKPILVATRKEFSFSLEKSIQATPETCPREVITEFPISSYREYFSIRLGTYSEQVATQLTNEVIESAMEELITEIVQQRIIKETNEYIERITREKEVLQQELIQIRERIYTTELQIVPGRSAQPVTDTHQQEMQKTEDITRLTTIGSSSKSTQMVQSICQYIAKKYDVEQKAVGKTIITTGDETTTEREDRQEEITEEHDITLERHHCKYCGKRLVTEEQNKQDKELQTDGAEEMKGITEPDESPIIIEPTKTKAFGMQTDVSVRREPLRPTVDEVTMCVSTSVGEYGPVDVSTPTTEVRRETELVTESYEQVSVPKVVKVESVSVQADMFGMRTVEASQHVLLEAKSDVSQIVTVDSVLSGAAVPSTGPTASVPVDRSVQMVDMNVFRTFGPSTLVDASMCLNMSDAYESIQSAISLVKLDHVDVETATDLALVVDASIQTDEGIRSETALRKEETVKEISEKVVEGTSEDYLEIAEQPEKDGTKKGVQALETYDTSCRTSMSPMLVDSVSSTLITSTRQPVLVDESMQSGVFVAMSPVVGSNVGVLSQCVTTILDEESYIIAPPTEPSKALLSTVDFGTQWERTYTMESDISESAKFTSDCGVQTSVSLALCEAESLIVRDFPVHGVRIDSQMESHGGQRIGVSELISVNVQTEREYAEPVGSVLVDATTVTVSVSTTDSWVQVDDSLMPSVFKGGVERPFYAILDNYSSASTGDMIYAKAKDVHDGVDISDKTLGADKVDVQLTSDRQVSRTQMCSSHVQFVKPRKPTSTQTVEPSLSGYEESGTEERMRLDTVVGGRKEATTQTRDTSIPLLEASQHVLLQSVGGIVRDTGTLSKLVDSSIQTSGEEAITEFVSDKTSEETRYQVAKYTKVNMLDCESAALLRLSDRTVQTTCPGLPLISASSDSIIAHVDRKLRMTEVSISYVSTPVAPVLVTTMTSTIEGQSRSEGAEDGGMVRTNNVATMTDREERERKEILATVEKDKLYDHKSRAVQADTLGMRTIEASQHVLLEAKSDVSQTVMVDSVLSGAAVPSTGPTALVSVDRRVRLTDVSVSYVREASIPLERLPSVVVSEKTLPRLSTQIEAMTTSMSLAVPTIDHTTIAVGPDVTDADHCTVCGHRFEPIRLVMVDDVVQTDVLYEVSDTGVGESVLQPMVSKEGVSVSSLICKDESCQTVSHRTTIVSELVESTGSESTSTWVDTLVAVQSGSVPVKGFGVQSDVLRPSGFVVDAGNHFHVRPSLEFSACFGSGVSPAVIIDRLLCCSAVSFVGPSARLRCPNCGYLCSAEDERETDHLPDGTLDDELTVDSALPSYGVGNVIDSLVAVDETGSTSWQPLSFKKTCATQFSFTPDLADVFCQATVHVTDEGTMTPDFTSSAAIVLQNKSVTDYREKLIEHYYYAPAHEASLVADVGIQTTLTESDGAYNISRTEEPSEEEILHLRKRYAKLYTQSLYETELDSGDIRETSCSVDISSPLISPDGRSLKVSATAPSQSLSSSRVSRRPVDVATQWSPSSQLHELIEKFDTLEIWESLHERCSTYESYQVRQDSGFVREQSVCTGHEDTMVADVGVQFTTTPDVHYKPPDSPDLRSASPASFVDTYEHYISRKRMGQLREEQCHATPLVYSNFTQTDTVPVQFSTEFDGLNQFCETVEIYHHRLLRDQVAEAWTQLDTDVAEEMTGGFDDRSLSEEQITEFRQKKRKRVVSQVQITEELSEEPGLMVCELGIQTESGLVDRESEQRLGRDIPSATRDDSLYLRATQAVQTSPITLESVLYSADWRWASEDLQTVLLTGLQATEGLDLRSSAAVRRFEQIIESSQKSVSHRTYYAEPSSKLLVSIGCQTGTIKPPLIDGELDRWTDTTSVYPELVDQGKTAYSSPVDDEIFVRSVSTESTDESKQVSSAAIIVHLRKRTVQYELLESRTHLPDSEWNNIREVASPLTGLFAPVSMAIRRGWIRLGEQNEYVDPATKTAIPLARAYEMGRIRLASPGPSRSAQPSLPILLLIERIYYSWRKTQLVSVVDTARGDVLTPEIALQAGILETTEDEIRFLDTLANTWITIEEGVGRQIIQTDEVDTSTDSVVEDIEEPATCRVFQLTHMCPGGEPGTWITPLEAARLGLFKWETGDVAADWPARPMLRHADPMNEWPIDAFVPTGWCSFLTARHAGWLRLTEMEDPSRWIVTDTQPYQEPNAVLLSTQIKLIAHTSSPANQYVDQFGVPQTGQIPDSTDVYSTGDTVNDYLRYATQLPDSGRNVVLSHRSRSYERDQNSYQEEASQHIYREVISERRIGHGSAEQFYTTDTFDTSESFSPSGLSQ